MRVKRSTVYQNEVQRKKNSCYSKKLDFEFYLYLRSVLQINVLEVILYESKLEMPLFFFFRSHTLHDYQSELINFKCGLRVLKGKSRMICIFKASLDLISEEETSLKQTDFIQGGWTFPSLCDSMS